MANFIWPARHDFLYIVDMEDSNDQEIEYPIDGILDLHIFAPREIKDLIPEYIEACLRKSIYELRIIHGKGSGTLRTLVHAILEKDPRVESFKLDSGSSSWGATQVNLKRSKEIEMDYSGDYAEYGFVAEIYDHVPIYNSRPDVPFYMEYAKQCKGEILELGCGTGRILIPLAQAGAQITGIDLSDFMLAVCREKIARLSEDIRNRITIAKMDMRTLKFNREFELITAPFRSFLHLIRNSEQKTCLASIHKHLKPRGRLILDIFNPSLAYLANRKIGEEIGDEQDFELPDGRRVMRRFKVTNVDYFDQIVGNAMIYYVTHPDGRREELVHSFPIRYIFRYEIEYLLNNCGFEVEDIYGDYQKTPYGSTPYPGELIVVARKK